MSLVKGGTWSSDISSVNSSASEVEEESLRNNGVLSGWLESAVFAENSLVNIKPL
ncbi:hypothetical protein QCA50_009925 [Cerrena zonata]|uniref:Uncharacterized protein n=1 Tax=Cerrena zonata TaxID=2478898 RepID=A0AAW0G054_9APHY